MIQTGFTGNNTGAIILFDGVCNLCNASIQFVIKKDPKEKFKFAALQSETGQSILKRFNLSPDQLHSVVLIVNDRAFERSGAALRIARSLNGLWPLLFIFIIIPPFLRNFIYDWIAKNRYKWFGKRNECMIPTPELKSRFI